VKPTSRETIRVIGKGTFDEGQRRLRTAMLNAIVSGLRLPEGEDTQFPMSDLDAARKDFFAFRRFVGQDDSGSVLLEDDFSRIYGTLLRACYEKRRHLAVKGPPQIGKSVDARLFALWVIGHNPALVSAVVSGDLISSRETVALCRDIVEGARFRAVFPEAIPDKERDDDDRKDDSKRRSGRSWSGRGWFLKAAGQRKDPTMGAYAARPYREDLAVGLLFGDDVITALIAASAKLAARVRKAWWETWVDGRASRAGAWVLYVQNHRQEGDLGDEMRSDGRFVSAYFGVDDDVDRMFLRIWNPLEEGVAFLDKPEAFNATEIAPRYGAAREIVFPLPRRAGWDKLTLGKKNERVFRQMYQLKGARPEDLVFPGWDKRRKEDKFAWEVLGLRVKDGHPYVSATDLGRMTFCAGLDLSGTTRRGCAFTVLARCGGVMVPVVHRSFNRVEQAMGLIDVLWKNGMRFAQINVENNGVQSQILSMMDALAAGSEWRYRLRPYRTGNEKMDPLAGLPVLNVRLESGELVWPTMHARKDEEWRQMETEFATCTLEQCRNGQTPDRPVSMWFAERALDAVGIDAGRDPGIVVVKGGAMEW